MADSDLEKAVNEIRKDIDVLKSLKEKLDSVYNPIGSHKDMDFQKVQIVANHYESWFRFMSSIAAGGLIGILAISATVYNTISILGGSIGFGISAISGVYIIFEMRKNHNKKIEKINRILNRIEKDEILPSIIELEHNP